MTTQQDSPILTLIMPCYNREYDLTRVLQAYENQATAHPFELIAIDDASSDRTFELLSSFPAQKFQLRAQRQDYNQGPAAARNRGIALAEGSLVSFVGDDILPDADFVQSHIEAHQREPETTAAFLGNLRWADDLPQNTLMKHIDGIGAQQFSFHYLRDGDIYDYRHFYTSNISLKRDILLSVEKWFDTDFIYAAFEDAELSYRLAQHKMTIRYVKNMQAEHYHYHTVWSFSTRQYRCGMMAWLMVQKHPRLFKDILRSFYGRVLSLARTTKVNTNLATIQALEEEVRHLASSYEWEPHALLDSLYFTILDYFYYKGLIDGCFSNSRFYQRLHGVHVKRYLAPTLLKFMQQARALSIPLPNDLVLGTLLGEVST